MASEIPAVFFETAYQATVAANPELGRRLPEAQRQQISETATCSSTLIRERCWSSLPHRGDGLPDRRRSADQRVAARCLNSRSTASSIGKSTRRLLFSHADSIGDSSRKIAAFIRCVSTRFAGRRSWRPRSFYAVRVPPLPQPGRRAAAGQSVATLTEDLVSEEITVTEEQVQAFYDENPTLFQLPGICRYRIHTRSAAKTSRPRSDVSEEALGTYYEDNKSRYLQDEERQARHILILFGEDEAAALAQAEDLLLRKPLRRFVRGTRGRVFCRYG